MKKLRLMPPKADCPTKKQSYKWSTIGAHCVSGLEIVHTLSRKVIAVHMLFSKI